MTVYVKSCKYLFQFFLHFKICSTSLYASYAKGLCIYRNDLI